MWLKYLSATFVLFLFFILQNSFLAHFDFWGSRLNLVFVSFFIFLFFTEKKDYYFGIFLTIISGLLLDIGSVNLIGVLTIILLAIFLAFKKIIYSLSDISETNAFFYFAPLFVILCLFYFFAQDLAGCLLMELCRFSFLSFKFLFALLYNLLVAIFLFYIYKLFFVKKHKQKSFKF